MLVLTQRSEIVRQYTLVNYKSVSDMFYDNDTLC